MESAVVVTCLSVALLAGMPAFAQTAKPAAAAKPPAASASANDDLETPPGIELSDRVKRDAARPMYWIKLHAESVKEPAKETAKAAPARPPAPIAAPAAAPAVAAKEPARESAANRTTAIAAAAAAVAPQAKTSAATPPAQDDRPVSLATGAPIASSETGHPTSPMPAPQAEQAVALATPSVTAPAEDLSPVQLVIMNGREPQVPDWLMRRLRQGTVQISIDVNNAGEVTGTSVVQSSNPRLDQPTMEAVRAMRFQPIRHPTTAILNFSFDLDK